MIRNDVAVNLLGAGESFGLSSFWGQSKRMASVRALTATTAMQLDFEALGAFFQFRLIIIPCSTAFLQNHLSRQQDLLNSMNDKVIDELSKNLEQERLRTDFGRLFITIVVILSGYTLLLDLLIRNNIATSPLLNTAIIVILGLVGFFYIQKSKSPKAIFGLSLRNWKPAVTEAIVGSFGLIGLGIGVKWVLMQSFPGLIEGPLLSLSFFHTVGWQKALFFIGAYALFIPFQEIIIRCAVQGSLQVFFGGRWAVVKAILTTSLMFSVLHLIMHPTFAYLSIIPSLFWGLLFRPQSFLAGSQHFSPYYRDLRFLV